MLSFLLALCSLILVAGALVIPIYNTELQHALTDEPSGENPVYSSAARYNKQPVRRGLTGRFLHITGTYHGMVVSPELDH